MYALLSKIYLEDKLIIPNYKIFLLFQNRIVFHTGGYKNKCFKMD